MPAAADGLPCFGFHYPAGAELLDLKSAAGCFLLVNGPLVASIGN